MAARIIDGKEIAREVRAEVMARAHAFREAYGETPALAVVLVALAISAFAIFVSCAAGVIAGILGAAVGSIAFLVMGILAFPAAVSTAIMLLGMGLAGLGISVLLGWLVIWAIKAIVSASIRAIKRSNEKRRLKKLGGMKDASAWKYKEEA